LLIKALDSIEIESDSNINSNFDINPCYDETLISSIISYHLNNLSRIINIHPKSDHWYLNVLFNYNKIQFHQTLRIQLSSFWMIVNKIRNHSIFKNIPQNTQNPVEKQLAIVLYRLGSKVTIWNIYSKFGISEDTVPLFIFRVVEALKSLKKDTIIWPYNNY
ncbi:16985_t:CDS:1, partial [Cetraspora pellucida]